MTLNEIIKGVVVERKYQRPKPEPQGAPTLSSEAYRSVIACSHLIVIVYVCLRPPLHSDLLDGKNSLLLIF